MRYECQLSYSSRFVGLKSFTEDDEYLYRGLKPREMLTLKPLKTRHIVRGSSDTQLLLRIVKALPFIRQPDRVSFFPEARCLPLKNISNGIAQTYKTRDDKVIYKFRCNSGFFLNDSTAISCFRGQRNGSTPSCLQGKEIFV
ncbi:unnamed protein product [Pocillopora meandrina]|uniref:Sushi domain-containing protein n=1 Tax=Pocillopora meandrina TaxID=46732 RepID=A0AAU9XTA0_9CNID|nr:unnamed protein product [Pocillopora meandrina]